MSYLRQRPRIPPTGRITVRLTTAQRDLFIQSADTPAPLGHALHRAPVREGKLSIRVTRESLEALIRVAATASTRGDRRSERALAALLKYLESLEDRFADADPVDGEDEADEATGRE